MITQKPKSNLSTQNLCVSADPSVGYHIFPHPRLWLMRQTLKSESQNPPLFFLTFPNLHLTRLTMTQKTGRYAKCVCSPCLSFSAHNWAPYTRTCHAGSHCHWCFHPLSPVAPAVKSRPSFLGSLNSRIHEGVVEFVPLLSLLTPDN